MHGYPWEEKNEVTVYYSHIIAIIRNFSSTYESAIVIHLILLFLTPSWVVANTFSRVFSFPSISYLQAVSMLLFIAFFPYSLSRLTRIQTEKGVKASPVGEKINMLCKKYWKSSNFMKIEEKIQMRIFSKRK